MYRGKKKIQNIKNGYLTVMNKNSKYLPLYWLGKDKKKISCKEKIKLMESNLDEFQEILNDIIDEAVLIGIDEDQLKNVLLDMIKNMKNNLRNV